MTRSRLLSVSEIHCNAIDTMCAGAFPTQSASAVWIAGRDRY